MITIRNAAGHVVAKGHAPDIINERAAQVPIERADIYPTEGPALLGVAFTDGSTGICEWDNSRACCDWVRAQPWAHGRTRIHFAQGGRPSGVPS